MSYALAKTFETDTHVHYVLFSQSHEVKNNWSQIKRIGEGNLSKDLLTLSFFEICSRNIYFFVYFICKLRVFNCTVRAIANSTMQNFTGEKNLIKENTIASKICHFILIFNNLFRHQGQKETIEKSPKTFRGIQGMEKLSFIGYCFNLHFPPNFTHLVNKTRYLRFHLILLIFIVKFCLILYSF